MGPSSRYARAAVAHERDLDAAYARFERIFEGVATAPFAFVDLDAVGANAASMLAQAGTLPIRVASKSVRSVAVLRRILALDERLRGVLAFTLPEALWLSEHGFDDIVVAYPTADREAVSDLVALAAADPERAPVPMVDDDTHLDLIEGAIGGGRTEVRVCIDLDVGWWPLGGRLVRIGAKRSPLHAPRRAAALAREVAARPGTRLAGLMAYEGQIAGVGDNIPGRPLRSAGIRWMQARSEREIGRRLPRIVAAVREAAGELEFVNGGGTGSLARTAASGAATELTAGSGFYAPTLFDHYRSLELTPAAFFALPVVRRPAPGIVTALGGGYVASGPPRRERVPQPYLPDGLRLDREEAAGEVQTPLIGAATRRLRLGDNVYMRHAKAGELCERFNSLYLIEGDRVVDEVPTYRGEGKSFL
jgi:D-serine deaminase-like pyridoxal phosphate-dependent protein